MSTVYADFVNNLSGQRIINTRGQILQCNYARTDVVTTFVYSYREYYNNEGGDNSPLPKLTLTNVENPNHIVLCQWQICGEMGNQGDCGFYVLRNGGFINVAGGASGPNQFGGSNSGGYWSWSFGGFYDGDQDSTTNTRFFTYWGPIGTTGTVTYGLRVHDTGGNDITFRLNRSTSSTGANNYEVGVTCGVIYEISSDGSYV